MRNKLVVVSVIIACLTLGACSCGKGYCVRDKGGSCAEMSK